MKGIIFNIVEDVVAEGFGMHVWDELLEATALDGIYTSLGSYPDQHLFALVGAASDQTKIAAPELLKVIGKEAIPHLYNRYPHFFDDAGSARQLILNLNTVIHPEVRKLYSGAGCPHFDFTQNEQRLTLGYNSPRKLCHLAHGFVDGVAAHFGETIAVHQSRCMHDGAATCHIELDWQ